jgi:hypothetical protein
MAAGIAVHGPQDELTGIVVPKPPSASLKTWKLADFVDAWHQVESASAWWKADIAAAVHKGCGEDAGLKGFAAEVGVAYQTLRNYRYVAEQWPLSCRQDISFTVAQELASLEDRFTLAGQEGWTARKARELVASRKQPTPPKGSSPAKMPKASPAGGQLHQAVKADVPPPTPSADAQADIPAVHSVADVQLSLPTPKPPWLDGQPLLPVPRIAELERQLTEARDRIAELARQLATARLDGALELVRAGGGGTNQRKVLDRLRAEAGVPVVEHQPPEPAVVPHLTASCEWPDGTGPCGRPAPAAKAAVTLNGKPYASWSVCPECEESRSGRNRIVVTR